MMRAALASVALLVVQPALAEEWKLVWSDEFDTPAIDHTKWDIADDCWGGGNTERQCYTTSPQNAQIEQGMLVITARHERATGAALPLALRATARDPHAKATREFTSAKLTTHGKAAWRYGRIEMRASLPQGQGTWPAFWMMPEEDAYGPWPTSGEIDILEAVNLGVQCKACPGGREETILGTLHFGKVPPGNVHKGTEIHFPQALSGFHTYAIEWKKDRMIWQVDGRTYAEIESTDWWSSGSNAPGAPFDQRFYLILNLAFGGGLAESRGLGGISTQDLPKRFAIDWVRVWQSADNPANPLTMQSGSTNTGEEGK